MTFRILINVLTYTCVQCKRPDSIKYVYSVFRFGTRDINSDTGKIATNALTIEKNISAFEYFVNKGFPEYDCIYSESV